MAPPRQQETTIDSTLPTVSEENQEIKQLQLLLVRQAAVPGLLDLLQEEVVRRIPKVILESPEPINSIDLELSTIAQPVTISTSTDLEAWLSALRNAITEALEAGTPVRIRVRR